MHPGIGFPAAADVQTVVGAAVIDQEQLEIRKGLGQNTFDARIKIGLGIVHRHDNTNPGGSNDPQPLSQTEVC